ncbi:MAG TPA: phenylalanine 4-monooxygenase [Flavobacteriales bacterium]|nr:phenylalanine 4-monooxygenase [Flavobacteriales bacterium]
MEKKQNYAAYSNEDFTVWKTLFERQVTNLEGRVSHYYLDALVKIGFTPNRIPDFNEVNQILKQTTGWTLEVVPAIVPEDRFFTLLSSKKFPATTWLRKIQQLDYLEEPDMFHDVFGHVPLLLNEAYVSFFKGVAKLAIENIDNAEVIAALGRIYWFTIEFGLINENGKAKAYGAGIISSFGETNHALSEKASHFPFEVRTIMHKPFVNTQIQTDYFVIESFEQLFASLTQIEAEIKAILKNQKQLTQ